MIYNLGFKLIFKNVEKTVRLQNQTLAIGNHLFINEINECTINDFE